MRRWVNISVGALAALLALLTAGGLIWSLYYRTPLVDPDPDLPVKGIDVSSHNGLVDFDAARRDGVEFVLIKATEGATFKDSTFAGNHRRALRAGLKVGAYHFFRFETNGEMQAINLLHSVRGVYLDFPLVIDVEQWGNPYSPPPSEVTARLQSMVAFLEDAGYPVMIYTNRDGYVKYLGRAFDQYPLWISSFTDPPMKSVPHNFVLWQYSHRGSVDGVAGRVDRNAFMGSREEFDRWLGSLQSTTQY